MKTWSVEKVRDCAKQAAHNKHGRPSNWAHADQRRTCGRWDRRGEYTPNYDRPDRG